MDATLDHTMMRVEDLEESLDWYRTHLDYEEQGRWEAETFTNVFLGPADGQEDVRKRLGLPATLLLVVEMGPVPVQIGRAHV